MPDFGNSFSGLSKDRKLTEAELIGRSDSW